MSPVTVGERVLVHLSWYLRYSDAFECPRETTQDGIAGALGISRAHAALELKRLKTSVRVEERMAHVAGARSRRKVYFLTPAGAGAARALRDHARAKRVLLADGDRRQEVPGAEAIESLKARGIREPEATQIVLSGDLVEPRVRPTKPERGLPVAEPFVGRDAELASLRVWLASPGPLAILLGVAGIGKTALAARAAREFPGPVWYRKVYGFDDARTFASALGDFLQRIDRPRLRSYLMSGAFDGDGLAAILREDLAGVLVVADDVHVSPEATGLLRVAVDPGGHGKVLATARERPEVLMGIRGDGPMEIVLGGLDAAASRALAGRLLTKDPGRIERVVAAGRGHPMALHVLASQPDGGSAGADRLLEDAILDGFDPALEDAAVALAVLRVPCERPADLGLSASLVRTLAGRGLVLRGPTGVALHDLAREVLLPTTPASRMRAAHLAAARAASRRGDPIEAAFHLLEARRPLRARGVLLAAGAAILDSPRIAELARLLSKVPPSPSGQLLLAEALDRLGKGDEGRALLTEIAESPRNPRRGEALLLMGRIASRRNALSEALVHLHGAVSAAVAASDPRLEGRSRRLLAVVLRKTGDLDAAASELDRAIPLMDSSEDSQERLRARLDHALIRLFREDLAGAARELEGLLADPAAGPREEAAIRSNLAIAWVRMSRPEEGAALFEESARAAERGGDFRAAGYALANAADAYLDAGRIPEAEGSLARARRVSEGFADPLLESTVLTNEGKVLAAQGRPGAAEERLRAGVERIRTLGPVPSLIERVDELARFYERAGRAEDALRWRRDLEGLRESLPRPARPAASTP